MPPSNDPSDTLDEATLRTVVRQELLRMSRTLLGLVCWTILSAVAVLLGLQLIQMAVYTVSVPAMIGFALVGVFVAGAGCYLLYLLWA